MGRGLEATSIGNGVNKRERGGRGMNTAASLLSRRVRDRLGAELWSPRLCPARAARK